MATAGDGSLPPSNDAGIIGKRTPLAPSKQGTNLSRYSEPPAARNFSMAGKSQPRSGGPALRQKSLLSFFGKQQAKGASPTQPQDRVHPGSSPLAAIRSGTVGLWSPTTQEVGNAEVQISSSTLTGSDRPVFPKYGLKTGVPMQRPESTDKEKGTWGTSRTRKPRKRVRYIESSGDEDVADGAFTPTSRSRKKQAGRSKERDTSDDEFTPAQRVDEDGPSENDVPMDELDNEATPRREFISSAHPEVKTPSNTQSVPRLKLQCFSAPAQFCKPTRPLSSPFAAQERKKERIKEFNDKNAKRYQWLQDIRDANGNRPDSPEYDPRTLYIPQSARYEFSPFEKQFWEIKATHWDTVVFFKKGKFYELYEKDADIGHQVFDLKLTDRVNMRMVGVPESSFDYWSSQFIARGHKVAKVEQLESALGKSLREKTDKAGGKKEQVIRRELTSILTAGTLVDESLLQTEQATYCMAIKEVERGPGEGPAYGICFVDTATGEFNMCDINDDVDRTGFETLLVQVKPREIVHEKGGLTPQSLKLIKNNVTSPIMNALTPEKEFWNAERTLEALRSQNYFEGKTRDVENVDTSNRCISGSAESLWPQALMDVLEKPAVISALGGLMSYLRSLKLDGDLVSLRNFRTYDPLKKCSSLVLDGPTLANLEVFTNSHDGTDAGSVYRLLNRCTTPFGKRLFRRWLCHPLRSIRDITRRLDAIEMLNNMIGVQEQLSESFRSLPDMERIITRVHAGSCKLRDFLAVLEAFDTASHAIHDVFRPHVASYVSSASSSHAAEDNRLMFLISEFPDIADTVAWFRAAFDWKLALKEGAVVPHRGVEEDYDEIDEKLTKAEKDLTNYLAQQRIALRCLKADYRHLGKDPYQLEVPSKIKVPTDWTVMSSTKNVKRYYNANLRKLVQNFKEAEELKKGVLKDVRGRIYAKFDEHYSTWLESVKILAEVDCLMSLAKSSIQIGEPCCRPEFLEPVDGESNQLMFEELRHPCIVPEIASDFIPNDIALGGDNPNMTLLTGPNMGGKSTLLRQTCVAIIMAQLGSYVPAKKCRMTPFDRIFTRIGANDNILAGQSTFMVELSETSKILQEASPQSMVVLDELGRGTSTFDGYSIAYSVLHYLAVHVGCLGLFSTHYGNLTTEFDRCPNIRLMHMDCQVDTEKREVTFLYKLADGVCPKSYGMNVASMAGVPRQIVDRAEEVAHRFEKRLTVERKFYTADRRLNLLDLANLAYIIRCLDTNQAATDGNARILKTLWKGWTSRRKEGV